MTSQLYSQRWSSFSAVSIQCSPFQSQNALGKNFDPEQRIKESKEKFIKNKDITEEFIQGMRGEVPILDTVTKKCKVQKTGTRTFKIILTQGLNRQIRRMCDYFDYKVVHLKRIRVMNIKLENIRPGTYRKLTFEEEKKLREMIGEK